MNYRMVAKSIFAIAILFMVPGLVLAQTNSIDVYINGSLVTDTNQPPLFSISNLLPGDTESGTVRIKNNGSSWIDAAVRSTAIGNNDLSKLIDISIVSGSAPVYRGKLSKFFSDSSNGLKLSRIGAQNTATFDFKISYGVDETELQNASLGFDLEFGVIDQGGNFSHPGGQPNPGNPGGENPFKFYNIIGQRAGDTYCTVAYKTTKPAAGQIIYSAEGEPHVFKYNDPPLYGYIHIYPEIPSSGYVTAQNFSIPGLDPCKKYYFRIVAYRENGLPTVSNDEYAINAARDCARRQNEPEGEMGEVLGASIEQDGSQNPPGRVEGASIEVPEEVASAAPADNTDKESGTCSYNFPWWAYALFVLYWVAEIRVNKKTRKFWYATAIIPVAVLVWMYLVRNGCNSWIPFAVMCLVSIIMHFAVRKLALNSSAQKAPNNPKFAV